ERAIPCRSRRSVVASEQHGLACRYPLRGDELREQLELSLAHDLGVPAVDRLCVRSEHVVRALSLADGDLSHALVGKTIGPATRTAEGEVGPPLDGPTAEDDDATAEHAMSTGSALGLDGTREGKP